MGADLVLWGLGWRRAAGLRLMFWGVGVWGCGFRLESLRV